MVILSGHCKLLLLYPLHIFFFRLSIWYNHFHIDQGSINILKGPVSKYFRLFRVMVFVSTSWFCCRENSHREHVNDGCDCVLIKTVQKLEASQP